ncbi:MAG TPA: hypothetical protein VLA80_00195 [Actinomycetota bacterium]|nr:hypothetical protein [Actinomycetota bacterium]
MVAPAAVPPHLRAAGRNLAAQYARLCWLGLLLTGDQAEAEELAQEALVRTWWR